MVWLILRQLKSKKPALRRKAAEQLCEAPDVRALRALEGALSDPDAEVRRLAATALSRLPDGAGQETLLGAMAAADPEVVRTAVLAARDIEDARLCPALVRLLLHENSGVRAATAQVLEWQGWRPASADEEIAWLVAQGHFGRITAFRGTALPALEIALRSPVSSEAAGAAEALGYIADPRGLPLLVKALKNGDPTVCLAVVDALCRQNVPAVVEPLISALRHRNHQVRAAAVEALGRLRAPAALEPLRLLLKDPEWEVRREVAESLGKMADPRAVEWLVPLLKDPDADVRETTAVALGSLNDRRAIGPLVLALRDPHGGVRRMVAAALSRLDTNWVSAPEAREAAEQLKGALNDDDPGVRSFVSQFLATLGAAPRGERTPAPEDSSASEAKRRKLAVSLFLAVLCDPERDLRQAAAVALGRLGEDRARSALMRAQADPDPDVRVAVAQALEALAPAGSNAPPSPRSRVA